MVDIGLLEESFRPTDFGFSLRSSHSALLHPQALLQRHTFLGQFFFCFLVLSQMHEPHATQHIGRLGELNVVITDDLYSVAPGIPKIKERTIKQGNTSCLECLAGRFLVIHDETEMATIVSGLPAALLKCNKLIAQVDEGHGVTLAAQLEFEETTVERQRLVNISYLQRNMIEAYNARSSEVSHHNLLCVEIKWVTLSQVASGCISESLRGSQAMSVFGGKADISRTFSNVCF